MMEETGECDTCGKAYDPSSRWNRCGECGDCGECCELLSKRVEISSDLLSQVLSNVGSVAVQGDPL